MTTQFIVLDCNSVLLFQNVIIHYKLHKVEFILVGLVRSHLAKDEICSDTEYGSKEQPDDSEDVPDSSKTVSSEPQAPPPARRDRTLGVLITTQ